MSIEQVCVCVCLCACVCVRAYIRVCMRALSEVALRQVPWGCLFLPTLDPMNSFVATILSRACADLYCR